MTSKILRIMLFLCVVTLVYALLQLQSNPKVQGPMHTADEDARSHHHRVSSEWKGATEVNKKREEPKDPLRSDAPKSSYEVAVVGAFGFPIPRDRYVDTYYEELVARAEKGDAQSAYTAARLASSCSTLRKDAISKNSTKHPFHQVAVDCSLIDSTSLRSDAHKLMKRAADLGLTEAALKELSFPPPRASQEAQIEWESGIEARLTEISERSDPDATLTLAQAYDFKFEELNSPERAIKFYLRFLELSSPDDPRKRGVEIRLSALLN